MQIRPLAPSDVPAAVTVAVDALPPLPGHEPGAARAWLERRSAHVLASDPEGCWVAEEDGAVRGVALAMLREGIWGLSLLAVDPARHARGTGTALLRAALAHGDGGRGAIIASSTDPKAMRLYARAGFALLPCVAVGGIVDRTAIPGGLGSRPGEDLEAAAAISRAVRGGAYAPGDLALMTGRPGFGLLALGDRGFAVHQGDGSPVLLCARDEAAAADLLWSCLAAGGSGETVHADFITHGQDWAIAVALAAGLLLSPDGPLYVRGELGPLRPWLPSGALL